MIAVYASCIVLPENQAAFEQVAREFIRESRTHTGCLSYNCGKVAGKVTEYAFVEKWASRADLDAHLAHDFLTHNAPRLLALTANGLAMDVVELLAE